MNANTAQLLFFGVIILVIIGLMFRNGRKRQRDAASMTTGLRPGAEIMTSSGIFGTITAIDEAENKITLSTGPTSELTVHRQAVTKIVTPVADDGTQLNGAPVVLDDAAADPTFGERITSTDPTAEDPNRRTGGATSKGVGE
jgi:preprotein translocase subunit YajC